MLEKQRFALQAIHTAVTAAQTATELQWKIISDNLIKYSPTGNFADIGQVMVVH